MGDRSIQDIVELVHELVLVNFDELGRICDEDEVAHSAFKNGLSGVYLVELLRDTKDHSMAWILNNIQHRVQDHLFLYLNTPETTGYR